MHTFLPESNSVVEPDIICLVRQCRAIMAGKGEARMTLYGSTARGDFDGHSDIDVAIIVENHSSVAGLTGDFIPRAQSCRNRHHQALSMWGTWSGTGFSVSTRRPWRDRRRIYTGSWSPHRLYH